MQRNYFSIIEVFDKYLEDSQNDIKTRILGQIKDTKSYDVSGNILQVYSIWFSPVGREFINNLKICVKLFELLEISDSFIESISSEFSDLNGTIFHHIQIETSCKNLISIYNNYKDKIIKKINLLSEVEKYRLNEGLHCFNEKCFYSSIILSVSAMESRLFEILKRENINFLESIAKKQNKNINEFTFGTLFNIYLDHKNEFNNIIPEKHESIFKVCNEFRIFSAHPKNEYLRYNNANTILSAVFDFLLDSRLKL